MRCTQEHCSRSPASEIARTFVRGRYHPRLQVVNMQRYRLSDTYYRFSQAHCKGLHDNIASPLPML